MVRLSPGIHDGWLSNTEEYIAQADENWPDLRHAPGYGPMDGRQGLRTLNDDRLELWRAPGYVLMDGRQDSRAQ